MRWMSPNWSRAASVAAIDCGRTPSAAASALAVAAPLLLTRVSAEIWEGVRSCASDTSRIRRRSRLNATRRSCAARAAESETPASFDPLPLTSIPPR